MRRMLDVREGEELPIPFSQRSTARDAMAAAGRERWRQVMGDEADAISDAEPLEDFLGTMPEHFARWDFEHRYLEAHVAKKLRCNWKVAQEAFDEGLHLGATHPQSAPYVGDSNSAIDVYGNWSRQISPSGTPIDEIPDAGQDEIMRRMLDVREGEELPIPFQQDSLARTAMARASRERWRRVLGDEVDTISDAELVDHWNYAVFPNLHPWGGYNRIVYRFRPNGDRHDECIFEVMFLTPFRGEKPPTATVTEIDFDESWTKASKLSTLAMVMEQDAFNMEAVQRGSLVPVTYMSLPLSATIRP
jgi:hypothetical protein